MNTLDIIAKLADVGVEADEKLVQKCLDAGWVINGDEDVLLLGQSINDQREQTNKSKLAKSNSKKSGKSDDAGNPQAEDAQAGGLVKADEVSLGDQPQDAQDSGGNQDGMRNIARIVDQELTVIKEELLAGSHEFAEGYSDLLIGIALNTADLTIDKFMNKAGGSQPRLTHFRSRGKELSAQIFGGAPTN
jgi:hypothetical protein